MIYEMWINYGADSELDEMLLDTVSELLGADISEELEELYDDYESHIVDYGSDDAMFKKLLMCALRIVG
jgi:hypothetical protein